MEIVAQDVNVLEKKRSSMPQASDRLRKLWGGDGGIGPDKAQAFLESRGYVLTKQWRWTHPTNKKPNKKECEAASFLCHEWDYGGFELGNSDGEKKPSR